MDEYISRFYLLLEESYKIDAQDRLEDINVIGIPHYKQSDIKKVIAFYRRQTQSKDVKEYKKTVIRKILPVKPV